jgi:hypothetical protein
MVFLRLDTVETKRLIKPTCPVDSGVPHARNCLARGLFIYASPVGFPIHLFLKGAQLDEIPLSRRGTMVTRTPRCRVSGKHAARGLDRQFIVFLQ